MGRPRGKRKAEDTKELKTDALFRPIKLRPCEICADSASGYHFGIISCEACKSFFRRSVKRNGDYVCERDGSCPLDADYAIRNQGTCPACRWKKCLQLGMSTNAAKKGRYSYERRAAAIQKSKSYWEGSSQDNQPSSSPCSSSTATAAMSLHSSAMSPSSEGEGFVTSTHLETRVENSNLHTPSSCSSQNAPSTPPFQFTTFGKDLNKFDSNMQFSDSPNPQIINSETFFSILEDSSSKQDNLDRFIEQTVATYDKQNFVPKGFLGRVPELQQKYLEEKREHERMFGSLPVVNQDDHTRILTETGVDVDGRLELVKEYEKIFEPIVRRYIEYFKGLPGFKSLPTQDAMAIIKNTKCELETTILFPAYNVKERIYVSPYSRDNEANKTMDINVLKMFAHSFSDEHVDEIYDLIGTLQRLALTDQEYAVTSGFALMNPNVCLTEEGRRKVEYLLEQQRKGLHRLFSRRMNEEQTNKMIEVIQKLVERMRKMKDLYNRCYSDFIHNYKSYNFGRLVWEICA